MFENDDKLKEILKNKPLEQFKELETLSGKEFFEMLKNDDVKVGVTKIELDTLSLKQISELESIIGIDLSSSIVDGNVPKDIDGSRIPDNNGKLYKDLDDLKHSVSNLGKQKYEVADLCNLDDNNAYFKPYFDFIKVIYNNTPFDINYITHVCVSTLLSNSYAEMIDEMEEAGENTDSVSHDLTDIIKNIIKTLPTIKDENKFKSVDDFSFYTHVLAGVLQVLFTSYMVEELSDDDE